MIIEPINDEQCLGQLTKMARELHRTTLIQSVAGRLRTRESVIAWMQSLPQTDDNGDELIRAIACDVSQRVRLLPDDPNCVERAFGALMLLEALDPKTQRALATIDRPMRHTGLVEKQGARWLAVDLFPRRNFDWGGFGKDVLQGTHQYVGKPVLKFYAGDAGGQLADTLGEQEDNAIDRGKKKAPPSTGKEQPKSGGTFRPPPNGGTKQQPQQARLAMAQVKGGTNGETEPRKPAFPQIAAGAGAPDDDDDPPSASKETQRWGWG